MNAQGEAHVRVEEEPIHPSHQPDVPRPERLIERGRLQEGSAHVGDAPDIPRVERLVERGRRIEHALGGVG